MSNNIKAVGLLLHDVSKPRNVENMMRCATALRLENVLLVGRRKELVSISGNGKTDTAVDDLQSGAPNKAMSPSPSTTSFSSETGPRVDHCRYFSQAILHLFGTSKSELKSPLADADDTSGSQSVPEEELTALAHAESPRERRVVLVGVEIKPTAVCASQLPAFIAKKYPKCEKVYFLPGNEGKGMSEQEMKYCHEFVKVSQFCALCSDEDIAPDGSGGAGSMNVNTALSVVLHQFQASRW